jgi:class 3 adenylate cyclase
LALIPIAAGIVGFFSVEGALAALAGVLFAIGFQTPDLVGLTSSLPVGLANPPGLWLLSGIGALAGSVAAQGARGRHVRELRAMGNAASAIAEVIRIQWRMEAVPSNVCVMSVDVAGSSKMKMGAAPLLAEYSFREYQRYVAEIVEAHQGRIHSTAGDGVVAAFDSCRKACAAAREIQRGMFRFNNESNRLRTPFRLRIGLHMDSVAGDLRNVEFSRVIDVAAHVESVAPVGGIAVTEPVAKRLLGERLEPAPAPVDGIAVYHLSTVEAA